MIKAVIFDLDGLIVESETIHSESYAAIIIEYGKKPIFDENGFVQTIGLGAESNWQLLKEKYAIKEDVQILADKKRAFYRKLLHKQKIITKPGFTELLRLLKKHKIKVAIASAALKQHVILVLDKLNLTMEFDAVVGLGDVQRLKPYPDVYLEALKRLKIHASQCLSLEDSETGVESAVAANIKVIAVPHKFSQKQNFQKAWKVVKSLKDINLKLLSSI